MERWYLIKYQVDTGYDYRDDSALIKAESDIQAKDFLYKYIWQFGSDYTVSKFYEIREFDGYIFTGKYGYGTL